MQSLQRIFILVVLALLVSACGSHRYTVVDPPKQDMREFRALEIADFTTSLNDPDSAELASRFADQLYAALMKQRAENKGSKVFDSVTRGSSTDPKTLQLHGTVVSFEKGSRAKRYFIGFGAGKAFCTIQARFVDKQTGEEVHKANFDGELSMSFFGGSAEEAVDATVKAFIQYFDQYFAEPS